MINMFRPKKTSEALREQWREDQQDDLQELEAAATRNVDKLHARKEEAEAAKQKQSRKANNEGVAAKPGGDIKLGKGLKDLLRHKAKGAGYSIDHDGWVTMQEAMRWLKQLADETGDANYGRYTSEDVRREVELNPKKRFELSHPLEVIPLGCKWRSVGSKKPAGGTELTSKELKDALQRKLEEKPKQGSKVEPEEHAAWLRERLEFKPSEVDGFKIKDALRMDSYVKVGDEFVQQAAGIVLSFGDKGRPAASIERIRAAQGHTMKGVRSKVGEQLTNDNAPDVAVHGSYSAHLDAILKGGLNRMNRQHIHLAKGLLGEENVISGMRANSELYIWVYVQRAISDGYVFYESANGVILCDGKMKDGEETGNGVLPPQYFAVIIELKDGLVLQPHNIRLLQRLFAGCSRVSVTKMHGGFSGSVVLRTDSYDAEQRPEEPTVTKLDKGKEVLKEVAETNRVVGFGADAIRVMRGPLFADVTGAEKEESVRVLQAADDRIDGKLEVQLKNGNIKLLKRSWLVSEDAAEFLRDPKRKDKDGIPVIRLRRQQDLPGNKAFFTAEEAIALLRKHDRSVLVVSHCWQTATEPDVHGVTLSTIRRYLELEKTTETCAVFIDFASLPQPDARTGKRTPEEERCFEAALEVMGLLYASITGTTVIQVKDVPERPDEYDGKVVIYVSNEKLGEAHQIEKKLGVELKRFGDLSQEVKAPPGAQRSRTMLVVYAHFADHECAVKCIDVLRAEGRVGDLNVRTAELMWNSRPYEGSEARGWTTFEQGTCMTVAAHLARAQRKGLLPQAFQKAQSRRDKVIDITGGKERKRDAIAWAALPPETVFKDTISAVHNAAFSADDREKVIGLLGKFSEIVKNGFKSWEETETQNVGKDDFGGVVLEMAGACWVLPEFQGDAPADLVKTLKEIVKKQFDALADQSADVDNHAADAALAIRHLWAPGGAMPSMMLREPRRFMTKGEQEFHQPAFIYPPASVAREHAKAAQEAQAAVAKAQAAAAKASGDEVEKCEADVMTAKKAHDAARAAAERAGSAQEAIEQLQLRSRYPENECQVEPCENLRKKAQKGMEKGSQKKTGGARLSKSDGQLLEDAYKAARSRTLMGYWYESIVASAVIAFLPPEDMREHVLNDFAYRCPRRLQTFFDAIVKAGAPLDSIRKRELFGDSFVLECGPDVWDGEMCEDLALLMADLYDIVVNFVIDPPSWLAQLRPLQVYQHGDLNLGNVLVDDHGSTWLIDFANSCWEAPFKDAAKLVSTFIFEYFPIPFSISELKSASKRTLHHCFGLSEADAQRIKELANLHGSVKQCLQSLDGEKEAGTESTKALKKALGKVEDDGLADQRLVDCMALVDTLFAVVPDGEDASGKRHRAPELWEMAEAPVPSGMTSHTVKALHICQNIIGEAWKLVVRCARDERVRQPKGCEEDDAEVAADLHSSHFLVPFLVRALCCVRYSGLSVRKKKVSWHACRVVSKILRKSLGTAEGGGRGAVEPPPTKALKTFMDLKLAAGQPVLLKTDVSDKGSSFAALQKSEEARLVTVCAGEHGLCAVDVVAPGEPLKVDYNRISQVILPWRTQGTGDEVATLLADAGAVHRLLLAVTADELDEEQRGLLGQPDGQALRELAQRVLAGMERLTETMARHGVSTDQLQLTRLLRAARLDIAEKLERAVVTAQAASEARFQASQRSEVDLVYLLAGGMPQPFSTNWSTPPRHATKEQRKEAEKLQKLKNELKCGSGQHHYRQLNYHEINEKPLAELEAPLEAGESDGRPVRCTDALEELHGIVQQQIDVILDKEAREAQQLSAQAHSELREELLRALCLDQSAGLRDLHRWAAEALMQLGMAGARKYQADQELVVLIDDTWQNKTYAEAEKLLAARQLTLHPWNHAPSLMQQQDFEQLVERHRKALKAQHATIIDALSGKRLVIKEQCVPIEVATGEVVRGASSSEQEVGKIKDVKALASWLNRIHQGCEKGHFHDRMCLLLSAPPAGGKTCLMSQLVMEVIEDYSMLMVPILIKVQQMLRKLLEDEERPKFQQMWNWVDAFLLCTYGPESELYQMLRQALVARRALILLDGIDEGGEMRQAIEQHITKVLAPQGHVMLVTSRPTGLTEQLFAKHFYRIELSPLSEELQLQVIKQRTEKKPELRKRLEAYIKSPSLPDDTQVEEPAANLQTAPQKALLAKDEVPSEPKKRNKVTGNPLMLSMVISIFENTAADKTKDLDKITKLYNIASKAMLERVDKKEKGAAASASSVPHLTSLLQAIFFEAHANEKREIESEHLEAASLRLVEPKILAEIQLKESAEARRKAVKDSLQLLSSEHADALRAVRERVSQDRLPLLSMLQPEPLKVQSSHLSFQEFFTAQVICNGSNFILPPRAKHPWRWPAWWANTLKLGREMEGFPRGLLEAIGKQDSETLALRSLVGGPSRLRPSRVVCCKAVALLMCVIKRIDLRDNRLSDTEAKELVKEVKEAKSLREINLAGNLITSVGARDVAEALVDAPRLEVLDLSRNDLTGGSGSEQIGTLANQSIWFRELILNHVALPDKGAKGLVKTLSGVAKASKLLGDDAPTATKDGNGMTVKALPQLAQGEMLRDKRRPLVKLELRGNDLGVHFARDLEVLFKACNFLEFVDLSDNRLGVEGGKEVAKAIRQPDGAKSLKVLNLSGNDLCDVASMSTRANHHYDDEAVEELFKAIAAKNFEKTTSSIRCIVLDNNRLCGVWAEPGVDGSPSLKGEYQMECWLVTNLIDLLGEANLLLSAEMVQVGSETWPGGLSVRGNHLRRADEQRLREALMKSSSLDDRKTLDETKARQAEEEEQAKKDAIEEQARKRMSGRRGSITALAFLTHDHEDDDNEVAPQQDEDERVADSDKAGGAGKAVEEMEPSAPDANTDANEGEGELGGDVEAPGESVGETKQEQGAEREAETPEGSVPAKGPRASIKKAGVKGRDRAASTDPAGKEASGSKKAGAAEAKRRTSKEAEAKSKDESKPTHKSPEPSYVPPHNDRPTLIVTESSVNHFNGKGLSVKRERGGKEEVGKLQKGTLLRHIDDDADPSKSDKAEKTKEMTIHVALEGEVEPIGWVSFPAQPPDKIKEQIVRPCTLVLPLMRAVKDLRCTTDKTIGSRVVETIAKDSRVRVIRKEKVQDGMRVLVGRNNDLLTEPVEDPVGWITAWTTDTFEANHKNNELEELALTVIDFDLRVHTAANMFKAYERRMKAGTGKRKTHSSKVQLPFKDAGRRTGLGIYTGNKPSPHNRFKDRQPCLVLLFNCDQAKFTVTHVEGEQTLDELPSTVLFELTTKGGKSVGQVKQSDKPFAERVFFEDEWKVAEEFGLVHDGWQGSGSLELQLKWGKNAATIVVEPWLTYAASVGARVLLDVQACQERKNTQGKVREYLTGTVVRYLDNKVPNVVVRVDGYTKQEFKQAEWSVELQPSTAVPTTMPAYMPGTKLLLLDDKNELVDGTVLNRLGDTHVDEGSRHVVHTTTPGKPFGTHLWSSLNAFNHTLAPRLIEDRPQLTAASFGAVKQAYCLSLLESEEKVQDAITGNELKIKDQLIYMGAQVDAKSELLSIDVYNKISKVPELVDELVKPSKDRKHGQHLAQPVLCRAGPGTGKTWMIKQSLYLVSEKLGLALGLRWKAVGCEKPKKGIEIINAALAAALVSHDPAQGNSVELTPEEVKEFSLQDLKVDSFVKSGEHYFVQASQDHAHTLVPIIIYVQRIVRMMRERGVKDADLVQGNDGLLRWYIKLEFGEKPEICDLLLVAYEMRSLVILVDGVDEAAGLRDVVEAFVHYELVTSGNRLVVTSRPEGVDLEDYRTRFVIMDLLKLSETQQRKVIEMQLKGDDFFEHLVSIAECRKEMDAAWMDDAIFPPAIRLELGLLSVVQRDETEEGIGAADNMSSSPSDAAADGAQASMSMKSFATAKASAKQWARQAEVGEHRPAERTSTRTKSAGGSYGSFKRRVSMNGSVQTLQPRVWEKRMAHRQGKIYSKHLKLLHEKLCGSGEGSGEAPALVDQLNEAIKHLPAQAQCTRAIIERYAMSALRNKHAELNEPEWYDAAECLCQLALVRCNADWSTGGGKVVPSIRELWYHVLNSMDSIYRRMSLFRASFVSVVDFARYRAHCPDEPESKWLENERPNGDMCMELFLESGEVRNPVELWVESASQEFECPQAIIDLRETLHEDNSNQLAPKDSWRLSLVYAFNAEDTVRMLKALLEGVEVSVPATLVGKEVQGETMDKLSLTMLHFKNEFDPLHCHPSHRRCASCYMRLTWSREVRGQRNVAEVNFSSSLPVRICVEHEVLYNVYASQQFKFQNGDVVKGPDEVYNWFRERFLNLGQDNFDRRFERLLSFLIVAIGVPVLLSLLLLAFSDMKEAVANSEDVLDFENLPSDRLKLYKLGVEAGIHKRLVRENRTAVPDTLKGTGSSSTAGAVAVGDRASRRGKPSRKDSLIVLNDNKRGAAMFSKKKDEVTLDLNSILRGNKVEIVTTKDMVYKVLHDSVRVLSEMRGGIDFRTSIARIVNSGKDSKMYQNVEGLVVYVNDELQQQHDELYSCGKEMLRRVAVDNQQNGRREFTAKEVSSILGMNPDQLALWVRLDLDDTNGVALIATLMGQTEKAAAQYQFKHLSFQEGLFAEYLLLLVENEVSLDRTWEGWADDSKSAEFLNNRYMNNTCRIASGHLGTLLATKRPVWNFREEQLGLNGLSALWFLAEDNMALEALNVSQNELTDADIQGLATMLATSTSLTELDLSETELHLLAAVPDWSLVCKAFNNNNSLQVLNLSNNSLGISGVHAVCKALIGCSSLERLGLSYNKPCDGNVNPALLDLFELHPALEEVQIIEEEEKFLPSATKAKLGEKMLTNPARKLAYLQTSMFALDDTTQTLEWKDKTDATDKTKNENIKYADAALLAGCLVTNTVLTELNVSQGVTLDMNSRGVLGKAMLDNPNSRMAFCNLLDLKQTSTAARYDLATDDFKDIKAFRFLAGFLRGNQTLKHVTLDNPQTTFENDVLAKSMQNKTTLEKLTIGKTGSYQMELKLPQLTGCADNEEERINVKVDRVKDVPLPQAVFDPIGALAAINSSLRRLDLSDTGVGSSFHLGTGAANLLDALFVNHVSLSAVPCPLSELDLSKSDINDVGGDRFFRALLEGLQRKGSRYENLKTLSVARNELGKNSAASLRLYLRSELCQLIALDVSGNRGLDPIHDALDDNASLTSLDVREITKANKPETYRQFGDFLLKSDACKLGFLACDAFAIQCESLVSIRTSPFYQTSASTVMLEIKQEGADDALFHSGGHGHPVAILAAGVIRLNTSLQSVSMAGIGIDQVTAERLATALARNKTLRHIDISGNPEIGDFAANLLPSESGETGLETICIDGPSLNVAKISGLKRWEEKEEKDSSLATVKLENKELGPLSAYTMGGCFLQNRTLTSLQLAHNNVDLCSATVMIKGLRHAPLKLLDLAHNCLGPVDALGSKWKNVGEQATTGQEVSNAELAGALSRKQVEFTQEELGHLQLQGLEVGSFIKVGKEHFVPAVDEEIQSFCTAICANLKMLQTLNLSHNKLSVLQPQSLESLCKLRSLMRLDLSHNRLQGLPALLATTTSLTELNASSNELTELHDSLCLLPRLAILDVSNNKLQALPERIGFLTAWQPTSVAVAMQKNVKQVELKLNFEGNKVERLPASICNFEKSTLNLDESVKILCSKNPLKIPTVDEIRKGPSDIRRVMMQAENKSALKDIAKKRLRKLYPSYPDEPKDDDETARDANYFETASDNSNMYLIDTMQAAGGKSRHDWAGSAGLLLQFNCHGCGDNFHWVSGSLDNVPDDAHGELVSAFNLQTIGHVPPADQNVPATLKQDRRRWRLAGARKDRSKPLNVFDNVWLPWRQTEYDPRQLPVLKVLLVWKDCPKEVETAVLLVTPWLAYGCAAGTRLRKTMADGSVTFCTVTKIKEKDKCELDFDDESVNTDVKRPKELDPRPMREQKGEFVIGAKSVQLTQGRKLIVIHSGEAVGAEVVHHYGVQEGNKHRLKLSGHASRTIEQDVVLNESNHVLLHTKLKSLGEYEEVRLEFCSSVFNDQCSLREEITGEDLSVAEQRVFVRRVSTDDESNAAVVTTSALADGNESAGATGGKVDGKAGGGGERADLGRRGSLRRSKTESLATRPSLSKEVDQAPGADMAKADADVASVTEPPLALHMVFDSLLRGEQQQHAMIPLTPFSPVHIRAGTPIEHELVLKRSLSELATRLGVAAEEHLGPLRPVPVHLPLQELSKSLQELAKVTDANFKRDDLTAEVRKRIVLILEQQYGTMADKNADMLRQAVDLKALFVIADFREVSDIAIFSKDANSMYACWSTMTLCLREELLANRVVFISSGGGGGPKLPEPLCKLATTYDLDSMGLSITDVGMRSEPPNPIASTQLRELFRRMQGSPGGPRSFDSSDSSAPPSLYSMVSCLHAEGVKFGARQVSPSAQEVLETVLRSEGCLLTYLNLGSSDVDGPYLVKALGRNTSLWMLDVRNCQLDEQSSPDNVLMSLGSMLLEDGAASRLQFIRCGGRSGGGGQRKKDAIIELLEGQTELNLAETPLQPGVVQVLCGLLFRNNRTLRVLNLSATGIGAQSSDALAHVLERNDALTAVDLSHNPSLDEDVAAFIGRKWTKQIHVDWSFTASGEVVDYDAALRAAIVRMVSNAVNLDATAVALSVEDASGDVRVAIELTIAPKAVEQTKSKLTSRFFRSSFALEKDLRVAVKEAHTDRARAAVQAGKDAKDAADEAKAAEEAKAAAEADENSSDAAEKAERAADLAAKAEAAMRKAKAAQEAKEGGLSAIERAAISDDGRPTDRPIEMLTAREVLKAAVEARSPQMHELAVMGISD